MISVIVIQSQKKEARRDFIGILRYKKDQDNRKPDSVHYGYLSGTAIADSLERPTRRHRTGSPQPPAYSVLLRMGFTRLPHSRMTPVSSYLAVSPLSRRLAGRFTFCCTFLTLILSGQSPLATILPFEVRTFLPAVPVKASGAAIHYPDHGQFNLS